MMKDSGSKAYIKDLGRLDRSCLSSEITTLSDVRYKYLVFAENREISRLPKTAVITNESDELKDMSYYFDFLQYYQLSVMILLCSDILETLLLESFFHFDRREEFTVNIAA